MRRVLVDTNVILDLLAERQPFVEDSKKLFSMADRKEIEIVISALSIANTYYVLNQALKIKEAKTILRKFKILVTSYELDDKISDLALNDERFIDFEDAIQYFTAQQSGCSIIITRNLKDFKKSDLPVMSPGQFLAANV